MSDPLRGPITVGEAKAVTESVTGLASTVTELNRRLNTRTILLSVAVAFDILLSLGLGYSLIQGRQLAECQASQYAAFSTSLQARAGTADQQTDAQTQELQNQLSLFGTLNESTTTAQKVSAFLSYQRAVNDQIAVLKAGKATRANNPLPDVNCR